MTGNIKYSEYTYLMNRIGYWLLKNNKSFKKRDVYAYNNIAITRNDIESMLKERGTNYKDDPLVAEYVECAIFDNSNNLSFLPNYVSGKDGTKYYKETYVDMANRVSSFEVVNGKSPKIVYIYKNNPTSNNTDATLKLFTDTFGSVTDIDSCLKKIQGKGYSYYYNSLYDTNETIKRIKNKKGTNCTDSSQLFYRLALALGYEVQFIHVKCSSGGGHVRLRLKHKVNTEGTWILRDPASVLSGNGIRSNWCTSNYTFIAYDPAWIFTDLYQ